MLNELKSQANITLTENGALTHRTTLSDCLDLFFRAGAMREAAPEEIAKVVLNAYAEDPSAAMKILFFARDVRGGLGERRFFRIAMRTLAEHEPDAVRRNIGLFAEYGRYDDLCALLHTPCEQDAVNIIRARLAADTLAMSLGEPASLLAKWLPSVNTSSREARNDGRRLAARLGMTERQYRQRLSALRRYTDILENRLREQDYSFDYSKIPSNAALKYRSAFWRNDCDRYSEFLEAVSSGEKQLHTGTLYPYDIVRACLDEPDAKERLTLDTTWNALPAYGESEENAIAVIDGSGSMYGDYGLAPINVALSLGLYFAEHTKGEFAGHFITFSRTPKLVEIKGADITEKVRYCSRFNEVADTNLEGVFDLILDTALRNSLPQEELPAKIYIISDMEFNWCVEGGNDQTLFDAMRDKYAAHGYELPLVVFWNVQSRQSNMPVTMSETGAVLVSGASPAVFDMVASGRIDPMQVMLRIIGSKRYAAVA